MAHELRVDHRAAAITDCGVSAAFISPTIVGMKYPNVNARSATAAAAAISHHVRKEPGARQAAHTFTSVRSVRGAVVTNAQNRRPVSSWRAASALQCAPDSV
jgi:hypothetical protein